MIFLTYWFYVFAAVSLAAYWLIRHRTTRLILLLVSCVVFHTHFAGPAGIASIVFLAGMTYLIGLSRSRWMCVVGIATCVLFLLFYKYPSFICLNLIGLFSASAGKAALEWTQQWLWSAPPLAISFFAFEFIHYLYDIRLGSPSLKNPVHFANFAIFWPSIVAGPIKRYEQFVPAMLDGADGKTLDVDSVGYGLLRVVVGFIKKAMADNLTAYLAVHVPKFGEAAIVDRWAMLGMLSLRIVWDFSGYSDMAIGFARMMGIRLPENFNWPYLAGSLTDFWRRWHISLSSWIRDYVYIPLGGSRHGLIRKTLNGLIAFALCGLWHGAAWNFVAWGVYHGIGLAVVSTFRGTMGRPSNSSRVWVAVRWAMGWPTTMLYVCFGWLLFFYPLPEAWRMFRLLFARSV